IVKGPSSSERAHIVVIARVSQSGIIGALKGQFSGRGIEAEVSLTFRLVAVTHVNRIACISPTGVIRAGKIKHRGIPQPIELGYTIPVISENVNFNIVIVRILRKLMRAGTMAAALC